MPWSSPDSVCDPGHDGTGCAAVAKDRPQLENVEANDCHTVGPESAGIAGAVHYYTDGPAGASRMMQSAGTRLE